MLPIIRWRKIWFALSGFLIASSLVMLAVRGLKMGTDFTGGSLLEYEYQDSTPDIAVIRSNISELGFEGFNIQPYGEKGVLVRAPELKEADHQKILQAFEGKGEEKRFESVGPTIGKELRRTTFYATILVVIFILLYVSWAFRKVTQFGKINAWVYGAVTVIALFHDIIILTGAFVIIGHYFGVEVDTSFVAALLTTLGYSVNDTIVVFDRIRENLLKSSTGETFSQIAEKSVNETLARSLSTSFTAVLTLMAMFLFGGETIRYFVLALIIGITAGTYSSIFLASPLLVWWEKRQF
ncbi:MAG: protein translocase subunit SecF [Candidatus Moranbacteria bacterium]|nr:protein translocase subunit SecF [Candidatus Moranbacteria bacterium]